MMSVKPTLNIWRALKVMKISVGNEEITINARELLFLINKEGSMYEFKTEKGKNVKISIKAEEEGKIEKIF